MDRRLWIVLALLPIAACSESPSGPTNGCADVSGLYDVTYQGNCPTNSYPSVWELQQDGCTVHSRLVPDVPAISGTVRASTVTLTLSNGFTTCIYQLSGTGRIDGQTIRVTLSGNVSGPCCSSATDSVQVVATRRH